MLTSFGKIIRHKRLDRGQTLKSMADHLGVSSSFLSAVELGKSAIPHGWVERISDLLQLSDEETKTLQSAAEAQVLERRNLDDGRFERLIKKLTLSRHELTDAAIDALEDVLLKHTASSSDIVPKRSAA